MLIISRYILGMINKFEAVGIFVCIGIMALALFFMRVDSNMGLLSSIDTQSQAASVIVSKDGENSDQMLAQTLADSMNSVGALENLIIDDVVVGEGDEVKEGDTVTVHYIGTLQNGQQFDNSYIKGTPFTFTVGKGEVIKGWDQGLLGMKKGGQRIIVVPSELAYGTSGMGPIPGNAVLVFSVELIETK
jgi:FKBP-type peptidyl-prolyl cis-trans isomerase